MWPTRTKPPSAPKNAIFFDVNDERSVTRHDIRDGFWNAIRRVTPHATESLRDEVYRPTYGAVHARERHCHPVEPMGRLLGIRHDLERAESLPPAPSRNRSGGHFPSAGLYFDAAAHRALLDALGAWGEKHHLPYDWVLALALETMHLWAEHPQALEELLLARFPADLRTLPGEWTFTVKLGPFVLESFSYMDYLPWIPSRDYLEITLRAYADTLPEGQRERRVRRMERVVRRKMRDDVRRWEAQGLRRFHMAHQRHRHAEWTVRAVVEQKNAKAISDELTESGEQNGEYVETVQAGERAVQKAVKQYCWLIGIPNPLRPGNPEADRNGKKRRKVRVAS